MFIDNVQIYVKAGDGGNGAVSFRREKYVSHGGPDGGDGGRGGNIVFVADRGINTLLSFRYKRKFVAQNGAPGGGAKFHGKNGDDIIISVPYGTLIKQKDTGRIIKDMSDDQPFICCHGGRGGWGNRHFATPTRQVPNFAKPGTPGEEAELSLELKMLADVGLIGYPSVGKSSILARISSAKPKIAGYHFTTLTPNLGVVSTGEERGFVAADIPGLIEGAADGAGLGHDFLRHIERCRLLLHVVDVAETEGRNVIEDIKNIDSELERYSPELATRPQLVVANKTDVLDREAVDIAAFEAFVRESGRELIYVSAATGRGLDELIRTCDRLLGQLPPLRIYESEIEVEAELPAAGERHTEVRRENEKYIVEGEWLITLMNQINPDDWESMNYFQRVLQRAGVFALLEQRGCRDGDTVSIYDFEFDYVK